MSNFDTANKIKFAMGSSQSFTISNWEQTQFGMKYNTSDGRFFDASKGLTDLLQEMNLQMNTPVTIEKRPNPNTKAGQQDYGMFYVNNLCLADVRNGAVAQPQATQPQQGTSQVMGTPPTTTAPAPVKQATPNVATSDTEARLQAIESRLAKLEQNAGDNLPF
jgi:hypothetical protein